MYFVKNKRAMSMISIFMLISVVAVFSYTIIEIVDRQLEIRENKKNTTSITFSTESSLNEIFTKLRLRPDLLKDLASVYEGAKIKDVSSSASGYVPEDLIGTFYSYASPGKFKFQNADAQKSFDIELQEQSSARVISVNHSPGMGTSLKIFSSLDGANYTEIYDAATNEEIEKTGAEVTLVFPEGKEVSYLRFTYGNAADGEVNEVFVYTNFLYDEDELLLDGVNNGLNKVVYNYEIVGNMIYVTSRKLERPDPTTRWKILSSNSVEARFFIDQGGNIQIYSKKPTDRILAFPKKFE